ncbi:hypothetical protein RJ55_02845 [Drechmeria coniospora]|nr:hypothetical protein RJ55_02845 [Drechmeria coniospora]
MGDHGDGDAACDNGPKKGGAAWVGTLQGERRATGTTDIGPRCRAGDAVRPGSVRGTLPENIRPIGVRAESTGLRMPLQGESATSSWNVDHRLPGQRSSRHGSVLRRFCATPAPEGRQSFHCTAPRLTREQRIEGFLGSAIVAQDGRERAAGEGLVRAVHEAGHQRERVAVRKRLWRIRSQRCPESLSLGDDDRSTTAARVQPRRHGRIADATKKGRGAKEKERSCMAPRIDDDNGRNVPKLS